MQTKEVEYLKKYMPADKFDAALELLKEGMPVQYIVGNVDFYGYLFDVTSKTLIPRFETEELVFKTINYSRLLNKPNLKILDIGTGSGCIAITLNKELTGSIITGTDISEEALKVAKANALKNKADVTFKVSDIFSNVTSKYDVIISNPPYIALDDEVDDKVSTYEPSIALYALDNGEKCYKDILKDAHKYLNDKFIIALEIGNKQGTNISLIAKQYFPKALILVEQDMQKRDRFIFIINK